MPPVNPPLVGREAELSYIESIFAESPRDAVVIAGAAGVGKSRLAAEVAASAGATGRSIPQVMATQAGGAVPLGAFATLLPDLTTIGHPAGLIQSFCRALADRTVDGQPPLLVVDDLQFLDAGSASLLHQLVVTRTCGLVATLRTPDVPPDSVVSLWKDGLAHRLDLQALSRRETDDLVALHLGGPVAGSALRWLWDVSAGNPLFVRELLIGAQQSGSAYLQDGIWFLRLPLPAPLRLTELIASRLDSATTETVEVVELLAVGEPLGYAELVKIAGHASVEGAENRGLITVRDDDGRTQVRLSHHLYREVVRQRIPRGRLRRLSATLAEAAEATGARRRGDVMRIARWRLDSGTSDSPELFERAAREARTARNLPLAARFARAALNAGGGVTAGLFLGETEFFAGRHQEAETVLAEMVPLCRTDEERALIANARAYNFGMLIGDEQAASRVIEEALSSVEDPEARRQLLARQASNDVWAGRLSIALAATDELLTSSVDSTRRQASYIRSVALALVGRTEDAVATAYRAVEQHRSRLKESAGGTLDYQPPEVQLVGAVVAHIVGGRLADAEADARQAYEIALDLDDREAQGALCLLRGWVLTEQGQLADAAQVFREGAGLQREVSIRSALRCCIAGVALAESMAGNSVSAAEAESELSALDHWATALDPFLVDRCRGWVLIASGELTAARAHFHEAADRARANGQIGGEAFLLHDLVRLGDAKRVSTRLAELAVLVDGDMVPAFAAHAAARAAGDPAAIEAAAVSFERIGALMLAAETVHAAATAYQSEGKNRQSAALSRQYTRLSNLCGSVRSPLIVDIHTAAPLSRREREIALLAASGPSSKAIAARLHVSVRTVDNHLRIIYAKLGVSGRDGLADALRDTGQAL